MSTGTINRPPRFDLDDNDDEQAARLLREALGEDFDATADALAAEEAWRSSRVVNATPFMGSRVLAAGLLHYQPFLIPGESGPNFDAGQLN